MNRDHQAQARQQPATERKVPEHRRGEVHIDDRNPMAKKGPEQRGKRERQRHRPGQQCPGRWGGSRRPEIGLIPRESPCRDSAAQPPGAARMEKPDTVPRPSQIRCQVPHDKRNSPALLIPRNGDQEIDWRRALLAGLPRGIRRIEIHRAYRRGRLRSARPAERSWQDSTAPAPGTAAPSPPETEAWDRLPQSDPGRHR